MSSVANVPAKIILKGTEDGGGHLRSICVIHFFGDGKNLSHNTIDVRIGGAVVHDTGAQAKSRLRVAFER